MVFNLEISSINWSTVIVENSVNRQYWRESLIVKIKFLMDVASWSLLWDNSQGNGPDMKPHDLLGLDHVKWPFVNFQYSSLGGPPVTRDMLAVRRSRTSTVVHYCTEYSREVTTRNCHVGPFSFSCRCISFRLIIPSAI